MKKKITTQDKARIGLEAIKEAKTINEIASQFNVHPKTVLNIKKEFLSKVHLVFDMNKNVDSITDNYKQEIKKLQEKIGEIVMENDWYKKKLES
jgi:putative transposase